MAPLSLIESLMSKKAKEFSEFFHVYFKAERRELIELMTFLDEVALTQSS